MGAAASGSEGGNEPGQPFLVEVGRRHLRVVGPSIRPRERRHCFWRRTPCPGHTCGRQIFHMRIFYAAQTTPNEISLPGSKLWYANLYLSLVDLGHELVSFAHPWLSGGYNMDLKNPAHVALSGKNRGEFSQALVDQVTAAHRAKPIQVFFSYLTSAHVEPEAIRQIAALGITTLNWYCNASYQFHNVAEIAPAYDFCLVPEKFRLSDYRRSGANPIYCQEAANPNVYRPCAVPRDLDVTFVGQKYGSRPRYLRRLID